MLKDLTKNEIFNLEVKYGMVSNYGYTTGSPEYWKEIAEEKIHTEEFIKKYDDYMSEYSKLYLHFKMIKELNLKEPKGKTIVKKETT